MPFQWDVLCPNILTHRFALRLVQTPHYIQIVWAFDLRWVLQVYLHTKFIINFINAPVCCRRHSINTYQNLTISRECHHAWIQSTTLFFIQRPNSVNKNNWWINITGKVVPHGSLRGNHFHKKTMTPFFPLSKEIDFYLKNITTHIT